MTVTTPFALENHWSCFRSDCIRSPQQHEVDPNNYPASGAVLLPGGGTPVTYAHAYDSGLPRDNLRQITEELQLQGSALDKHMTHTVGGFYCPVAFTGTVYCPASRSEYGSGQTSKALYAQGTFDFGAVTPALEGLRLTAGYRHTWDSIFGFSSNCTPQLDGVSAKCASTSEIVLLFGKVSRGYKSGGFDQQAVFVTTRTFEPETVTSYEAGSQIRLPRRQRAVPPQRHRLCPGLQEYPARRGRL